MELSNLFPKLVGYVFEQHCTILPVMLYMGDADVSYRVSKTFAFLLLRWLNVFYPIRRVKLQNSKANLKLWGFFFLTWIAYM